jgi:hypothetical protein
VDTVSVHSVDDLIDLNDDRQSLPVMTNNIHSSPNLQQQETSSNTCPEDMNEINSSQFFASSQTLSVNNIPTTSMMGRRSNWETFE